MCVWGWGRGSYVIKFFVFVTCRWWGVRKMKNTCMMGLGAGGRKILVTQIKMYPTPPDKNEYS